MVAIARIAVADGLVNRIRQVAPICTQAQIITWLIAPTRVCRRNGISIGLAVFAWLTVTVIQHKPRYMRRLWQ